MERSLDQTTTEKPVNPSQPAGVGQSAGTESPAVPQAVVEARYRALFDDAPEGILVIDGDSRYVRYASPAICHMLGYPAAQLLERRIEDIHPEDERPEVLATFPAQARGEARMAAGVLCQRQDGSVFYVDVQTCPLVVDGRSCVVMRLCDVDERLRLEMEKEELESQLAQARKLVTVGRLAAGVADDVNNTHHVILGYGELVLGELDPAAAAFRYVQEIMAAAKRSTGLTQQLVALAHQRIVSPRLLDVNSTVADAMPMWRRLLGKDMDAAWVPGPALWPIWMDPWEFVHLLLNLAVHATELVAHPGQVTLRTENVVVRDAADVSAAAGRPGDYVLLTAGVARCGGLLPQGAGGARPPGADVGWATMSSMVQQQRGWFSLDGPVGGETTINIYLPRYLDPANEAFAAEPPEACGGRGETVLLVEDDPLLLTLVENILTRLQYTVLGAGSPTEALRLAQQHSAPIDLLITDIMMPGLTGPELAERLCAQRPHLKQLFMSGYTAEVIAERGVLAADAPVIHKPFSTQELGTKVREVLDAAPTGGATS